LGGSPLQEHWQGKEQQDAQAVETGKGGHWKRCGLMDGSKVCQPLSQAKNIIPTPQIPMLPPEKSFFTLSHSKTGLSHKKGVGATGRR
jgi:hypothetical protein